VNIPPRMILLAGLFAVLPVSGCVWDRLSITKPDVPPPPADTFTLRADGLVPEKPPEPGTPAADLVGAHELFRKGEYVKAENLFHRIAENKKAPIQVSMEARYYEAESLRFQGCYPAAADTYVLLLKDFQQNCPFKEQACQHMYDIANYWLDDTREEMRETREMRQGKRWCVWPHFVSFEKSKPLLDEQGRAIQKLEQVRLYDPGMGSLADKALFLCGSVKFFNENYKDADYYFTQIYENHRNSPLAAQAVELAIISKHLSTGGSDYDGRPVAKARELVHAAMNNYPELANNKQDFLKRQIEGITAQQADKDLKMAEFYKRTDHPGASYFYYSLVTRRYPGTSYAKKAMEAMAELKEKVEKEEQQHAKDETTLPKVGKPSWFPFLSDNRPQNPSQGSADGAAAMRPTP
jgi:outer membrane protein assembly factor BamD (BamD/ComL family)